MNSPGEINNKMMLIKTEYNKDLRKMKLPKPIEINELRENICKNYSLKDEEFEIYYIDDEKDKITIGNVGDLNLAIELMEEGEEEAKKSLKIYVRNKTKTMTIASTKTQEDNKEKMEKTKEDTKQQKSTTTTNKSAKKKVRDEDLIKIQKGDVKLGLSDGLPSPPSSSNPNSPSSYSFGDFPSNDTAPNQPFIGFQNHPEDTKPMMKLQKPIQQPNQPIQNHPEDTKPMMKLQKPIQPPNQNNQQNDQSFIPFENHSEDTKPIMKLQKPIQQPNQPIQNHPEDTKPMMKLEKPIQLNIQLNIQNNQPIQNHPEDTKPIMKLEKPIQQNIQQNFPYEQQLQLCCSMGFKDNEKLRSALLKNNGNLESSIQELVN